VREIVGAVADPHEEVALFDQTRVDLHAGRLVGPGRAVEPARAEGLDLVQ
jgi:hypothetical protein